MEIIARHLALACGLTVAFAAVPTRRAVVAMADRGPAHPNSRVFSSIRRNIHPTGRTISVGAGGDFQAAPNAANPATSSPLTAGATFTGPLYLAGEVGIGRQ
jgi:hypothetical protein